MPDNFFTPQQQPEQSTDDSSILGAFFKGIVQESNSLVSPEQEEAERLGEPNAMPPVQPEPEEKSNHPIANELGRTFANPVTHIFGPAGTIQGLISSGATGWANAINPDHPIANSLLGAGAAMLTPVQTAHRLMNVGLENLGWINKPVSIAAQDIALGGERTTAAGVSDNKTLQRFTRALRESPFSAAIDNAETRAKQQAEGFFDTTSGTTPESIPTRDELGTNLISNATAWQKGTEGDLKARNLNLNTKVDPSTTTADDVTTELNDLKSKFIVPPAATTFEADNKALKDVNQIIEDVKNYNLQQKYGPNWGKYEKLGYDINNMEMPLAAIQVDKNRIADRIKTGLLDNQLAGVRNDRLIWGTLSNLEQKVYAGTPYLDEFMGLKKDWSSYFDNYENHIVQFMDNNNGLTPKQAIDKLLPESNFKDVTKLKNSLDLLPPSMKQDISDYIINSLGRTNEGNFDITQFSRNWQNPKKISPEMKDYLFGNNVENYDKLVEAGNSIRQSMAAVQPSRTSGTSFILDAIRKFGPVVAGAGLGGAGAYGAYYGQSGNNEQALNRGYVGASVGAVSMMLAPKLLANPMFVRMLATNPPIEKLPVMLKAIAANNPNIATEVTSLQNYIQAKQQQKKDNPNFFEQGYPNQITLPPQPTQENPIIPPQQEQQKNFKPPARSPNFFDNEIHTQNRMSGGIVTWPDQSGNTGYMNGGYTVGPNAGGRGAQWMTNNQYKEGGAVIDQFYNTVLSPEEEKGFQEWKKKEAPNDSGVDYDLKGAYKEGLTRDTSSNHFSDEFKKPNHPTFSDQSKYSKENPDLPAGHWGGENEDIFQPPAQYNEGGITNRNFALGGLTQTRRPTQKKPTPEGYPWNGYAEGGEVPATDKTAWQNNTKINLENDLPKPMSILDQIMNTKQLRQELTDKNIKGFIGGGSVWDTQNMQPSFADGGEVVPFKSGSISNDPSGGVPIIDMFFGRPNDVGWGVLYSKPGGPDDSYPPQPKYMKPANDLAQGGFIGDSRDQIAHPTKLNSIFDQNLAQGGIAHNKNDPRPFYNPQLPNVVGGGWKNGGFVPKFWGGGGVPSEKLLSKTEI